MGPRVGPRTNYEKEAEYRNLRAQLEGFDYEKDLATDAFGEVDDGDPSWTDGDLTASGGNYPVGAGKHRSHPYHALAYSADGRAHRARF